MDNALLYDLAVVVAVAGATTWLCHWLRQPVVLGYLLAGVIVGPHTPPFSLIRDLHSIHTMAELGLVVLMFTLGLEFSLPKLRRVGLKATLATLLEIVGMLGAGYALGRAVGWSIHDSIYLGAILSISSTTIIIKVLSDLQLTREAFAQAVFGILILEDVAAMVILTVLSGLGLRHENEGLTILRATIRVTFFVVLFLLVGLSVIPRVLRWVAKVRSREMTDIIALALCLSSAILAKKLGFSVALGSFLMGAVIAASAEAEHIEEWIQPIKDLFSAIFFVSAGLLIDPGLLWSLKGIVLLIAGATVVEKILMGAIGSLAAGYPIKTSFRIGMTLAQIGEFSFVFASLGVTTGLSSPFLYPLAVAISAVTTVLTPYLIRNSDAIVEAIIAAFPPRAVRALDEYQARRARPAQRQPHVEVLSRYLWRLGIYSLLLTTGFLISKAGFHWLTQTPGAVWKRYLFWAASYAVLSPFIYLIAGYVNHFLLLALTEAAARTRAVSLFLRLPIQRLYNLSEAGIWCLIALLWLTPAWIQRPHLLYWLAALAAVSLFALIGRAKIRAASVRIESLLDEIIGLATSEPLRKAAIAMDGPESLLKESIQRVLVRPRSNAVGHTLRELRLRERSGISVIGIYRDGTLNTDALPDTALQAHDILVLLGNAEQCAHARKFF